MIPVFRNNPAPMRQLPLAGVDAEFMRFLELRRRTTHRAGGEVMSDHGRGCEGRNYVCTCGYDDAIEARATAAEAENARLREALSWYASDPLFGNVARSALGRKASDTKAASDGDDGV